MPNTWLVSVSEFIVLHCSRAARNNSDKYVIALFEQRKYARTP
jgi:hypothetical protein